MKTVFLKKILLIAGLVVLMTSSVFASSTDEEKDSNKNSNSLVKVLVIGLRGNVGSNYFRLSGRFMGE